MHLNRATYKQRQQSNKNAVEVARKCDNTYRIPCSDTEQTRARTEQEFARTEEEKSKNGTRTKQECIAEHTYALSLKSIRVSIGSPACWLQDTKSISQHLKFAIFNIISSLLEPFPRLTQAVCGFSSLHHTNTALLSLLAHSSTFTQSARSAHFFLGF